MRTEDQGVMGSLLTVSLMPYLIVFNFICHMTDPVSFLLSKSNSRSWIPSTPKEHNATIMQLFKVGILPQRYLES